MITELDQDSSGDIDLKEFLTAMQAKTQDPEGEEVIMEAFKIFDVDGSGALSHQEMREVLQHLGEKMEDEEITDLIAAVDQNDDGEIQLNEFLAVVLDRAFI
jgi:Ca2+-binding EF-hand superfamily protein